MPYSLNRKLDFVENVKIPTFPNIRVYIYIYIQDVSRRGAPRYLVTSPAHLGLAARCTYLVTSCVLLLFGTQWLYDYAYLSSLLCLYFAIGGVLYLLRNLSTTNVNGRVFFILARSFFNSSSWVHIVLPCSGYCLSIFVSQDWGRSGWGDPECCRPFCFSNENVSLWCFVCPWRNVLLCHLLWLYA